MEIFSDPNFIRVITAIGIIVLWISTCWATYMYGHFRGYNECMTNIRTKRRVRRKHTRDGDIHVLNSEEPYKHYTEAESVRIVATHAPRSEETDTWWT